MRMSDWSSDLCSSDLLGVSPIGPGSPGASSRLLTSDHDTGGQGHAMRALVLHPALKFSQKASGQGERRRPEARLDEAVGRSEARGVGKEGVSTCETRWSPDH